jgi:hypothetical protein
LAEQSQHDSVVDKTSALHTECETLLRDKNELEALANSIESHLQVACEGRWTGLSACARRLCLSACARRL